MTKLEERIYHIDHVVTFRKTSEPFGGLSNMAAGYPLIINGVKILTSEALYQSCRYPHLPEVQKEIINQKSPMAAKMKSKKFRPESRDDWEDVRIPIMRWCLKLKLLQNFHMFGELLKKTGTRKIVEVSRRDRFWGAVEKEDELIGVNALGRLLMELREDYYEMKSNKYQLNPLPIPNFLLLEKEISPISIHIKQSKECSIEIDQVSFPLENKDLKK